MPIRGAAIRVPDRLKWPASLALAVVVNVLAVAILAMSTHRPFVLSASPTIELQLLPPLRSPTLPDRRAVGATTRRPLVARPVANPRPPTTAAPSIAPAAVATGQIPGSAAADDGGRPGELGRILRANLGCNDPGGLRLTAEERARCAQRMGQGARQVAAMPAPIDPGKRAWFDATSAAYHPKDPLDSAIPVPFGCKIRFGGPHSKFKPANSLKIPGLPCYVIPPRGVLTEESAVTRPEHVEARP